MKDEALDRVAHQLADMAERRAKELQTVTAGDELRWILLYLTSEAESLADVFDSANPFSARAASNEARARANNSRGSAPSRRQHPAQRTKLTPDQEREIAAALDAGEQGKPLARKHQVSPRTIRRIKERHSQRPLALGLVPG